jgi:hypothetical protein
MPRNVPRALVFSFVLLASCGSDEAQEIAAPTAGEQLCTSLVASITGCAEPSECQQALAGDCADIVGVLGDPFLTRWRSCLDEGGNVGTCAVDAGKAAEITETQRAFGQSFCDHCALGVPGCVDVLFGGANPELAPVAAVIAPLSDDVVEEITAECTQGLTCLATFSNCVQGVLAKRALPEKTMLCLVDQLSGTAPDTCSAAAATGAGGAGGDGAGGASNTGGSGNAGVGGGDSGGSGSGGALDCATDGNEPNDSAAQATLVDGANDNKLSDCEGDLTITGELAGDADREWFSFYGMDSACLADIQPHAIVEAAHPVTVCVYLDPAGDSAPPTCLEGTPAEDGSYTGCCGNLAARLQFGANLKNDDAHVRVVLSTTVEACIDYSMVTGYGTGN